MLGRRHPTFSLLRTLRRDRAFRDARRLYLAEGVKLAGEALASGAAIRNAIYSERLTRQPGGTDLLHRLGKYGVIPQEAPDDLLNKAQDARSPQPVVLVVEREESTALEMLDGVPAPASVVVTVGLQDPGNLGSIIRTSEAAGVSCLLAAGEHVDPYHPRTVRATAGAIFRLPVCVVESIDDLLPELRGRGIAIVISAAGPGVEYHRFDWRRPFALLLGREGSGLPHDLSTDAGSAVRIGMKPGVESLSVGAAAAVLLFEAARQRSEG